MVKAGYVEFDEGKMKYIAADFGVPQGSIISPLLSNVILHVLDLYMEELIKRQESLNESNPPHLPNPRYVKTANRLYYLNGKKKRLSSDGNRLSLAERREREALLKERNQLKSTLPNSSFLRFRYVRYADD